VETYLAAEGRNVGRLAVETGLETTACTERVIHQTRAIGRAGASLGSAMDRYWKEEETGRSRLWNHEIWRPLQGRSTRMDRS